MINTSVMVFLLVFGTSIDSGIPVTFHDDVFTCGGRPSVGCTSFNPLRIGIVEPDAVVWEFYNMSFERTLSHEVAHSTGIINETEAEAMAVDNYIYK